MIGTMIYWRFKAKGGPWNYGFAAETLRGGLLRIGNYNGDYTHGGHSFPRRD